MDGCQLDMKAQFGLLQDPDRNLVLPHQEAKYPGLVANQRV